MKTVLKKLSIIVGSVALIVAVIETGDAADWNFYGSARMATWWNDRNSEAGDDDETEWFLQRNSRIGARIKNDPIRAVIEYGTGVNLRFLYGEWNFGPGKLVIGQAVGPAFLDVSNQVFGPDSALLDVGGGFWVGRRPVLSVIFGEWFSTHAWFSLVQPQTARPITAGDGDADNIVPKFEASFAYKRDWFRIRVIGGYQTFEVENSSIGDYDVDAYVIGIGCLATFGPMRIKASLTYGSNWSNYGAFITGRSLASISGTGVADAISLGTGCSFRYKANDRVSLEAGYGYLQHDPEVAGQQEDNTQSYYIQCNIRPVRGAYIIPEVGIVDFMEASSGADQGKNTYIGAQWKINF